MNSEAPKTVSYRLLVPYQNKLYKIGRIMIKTFSGDIFYTPSQAKRLKNGHVTGTIDHLSFHKSDHHDNLSVKFQDAEREVLSARLPIVETGFQRMFEDIIFDVSSLPKHTKPVAAIDLVFDEVYDLTIQLTLSIISGRLIVEPNCIDGVTVTQRSQILDSDLLSVRQRCLGWHSGNADKLMQYSLSRCKIPEGRGPNVKRTLFIPASQEIRLPSRES